MMNRTAVRWALVSMLLLVCTAASFGQIAIGVSVRFGPPAIPVYAQPICPGPGYFWTPGYWSWNDDAGYYWVPGTWVVAPIGMFWTPGYWGWGGGYYAWHGGYWGPHVGFYGGINYGFGYGGVGFAGGEWRGRDFYYNRSVTNVSVTNVTNVYNRTVIVNNENRVSFNGGQGGIQARASRDEERWEHERHSEPLGVQMEHERVAARTRENFASENHGRPAFAATARPGEFDRRYVVPARAAGGEYRPPVMSPREARVNGPANRGNEGGRPNEGGRSNEGFRPFTPPSKNGNPNSNERGGNPSFRDQPRNNGNNENRVNENRANQPRNNEMRPTENRNNQNRNNEMRGNENRNNERRNESRPVNEPRPNARPAENAPRHSSPPPPAKQEHPNAPPKEEHHHR